ncbi:hypothetical protein ACWEQ3_51880, partial [Streptomyces mirabilis]
MTANSHGRDLSSSAFPEQDASQARGDIVLTVQVRRPEGPVTPAPYTGDASSTATSAAETSPTATSGGIPGTSIGSEQARALESLLPSLRNEVNIQLRNLNWPHGTVSEDRVRQELKKRPGLWNPGPSGRTRPERSVAFEIAGTIANDGRPVRLAGGAEGKDGSPSGPAMRLNADVMENYYQDYSRRFNEAAHLDFTTGYSDFAAAQQIVFSDLAWHPRMIAQMAAFHGRLVEARQQADKLVSFVPRGSHVRLYRKMAAAEASQIVGNRNLRAGFLNAMLHNRSDRYRKFFTTSLSHTSEFSNMNAISNSEMVLEFSLPWDEYWNFVSRYGVPNQQAGVYGNRDSALVHQERLRWGPLANFTRKDQVDQVVAGGENHNVGVGHGNSEAFSKLLVGVREVKPREVAQAAQTERQLHEDMRRQSVDQVVAQTVQGLRPLGAPPAGDRAPAGLRGGSQDRETEPIGWPLGRALVLEGPRSGGVIRVDAPAPTGAAEDGKRPESWTRFGMPNPDRPGSLFTYEASDVSGLRFDDGEQTVHLPADGWVGYGDDFLHPADGALLRGDSGWIGRVDNWETLRDTLNETTSPLYRVHTDQEAVYLVPRAEGPTVRLPLTPQRADGSPDHPASEPSSPGDIAGGNPQPIPR